MKSIYLAVAIKNTIVMICWTALAIYFGSGGLRCLLLSVFLRLKRGPIRPKILPLTLPLTANKIFVSTNSTSPPRTPCGNVCG